MPGREGTAVEQLRKSAMMGHLLDALDDGEDIGHYGRLVFAMVSRHFMEEDELVGWLTKDPDMSEEEARSLFRQVQERDYSPPKRERVLEWQAQQAFPICPNADDPAACNVYRDLQFPDGVYEHIQEFYEERTEAQS
jgi:hypothetical protein